MGQSQYQALWCAYLRALQEACRRGNFQEAQALITCALNDAEDLGEIDARLVKAADNVALLFHARHQDKKAELLYKQLFEVREKVLGVRYRDLVDSLEELIEAGPRPAGPTVSWL